MSKIATLRPCRSCNTDIYLLLNVSTGRWMPVEADPSPGGNIRVDVYRQTAEVLAGAALAGARHEAAELHLAHHINCPAADRHRRPKNGTPPLFDPEELQ